MIRTVKRDAITNIVLLLFMTCFFLDAMDNKQVVHEDLLCKNNYGAGFPVHGEYISLAQCLRDNRHVRVLNREQKPEERILQFYNNGKDALQWIIPTKDAEIEEKWKELKYALDIVMKAYDITKIVFLIKPEDERLKKIRKYSCLIALSEADAYDVLFKAFPEIKIEYKPSTSKNDKNDFFLYKMYDFSYLDGRITIPSSITRELLDTSKSSVLDVFYPTKTLLQDNSKISRKPQEPMQPTVEQSKQPDITNPKQPDAPPKKSSIVAYVFFGGGTLLTIFFIGWYLQHLYARKIYN